MRFVDGWDEQLLQQLRSCSLAKPVLTTYPLGYELPSKIPSHRLATLLCADGWRKSTETQLPSLRLRGRVLISQPSTPPRSLFWAAGFSFSSSEVLREVPYDPDLAFVFFGEGVPPKIHFHNSVAAPLLALVVILCDGV